MKRSDKRGSEEEGRRSKRRGEKEKEREREREHLIHLKTETALSGQLVNHDFNYFN